jgi:hypothetical protein
VRVKTNVEPQWEQLWLPLWPYASDDLRDGIYRESREKALGRRYIEANPQAISNLLVVDIDHEDALLRAVWERHLWLPNAVVENPLNGHAHAVWALKEPVTRTQYARRKPLAYAAAVTEGLRRSVDGDKGYSGLMTKNPEHDAWEASWFTDKLYSLTDLHSFLSEGGFMPPPSWKRTRRKNPVGLGRNCSLFETARTWAYSEAKRIRKRHEYATPSDADELANVIEAHAQELNLDFSEPLPRNEVTHSARSITKWITTEFYGWIDTRTKQAEKFSKLQSHRAQQPRGPRGPRAFTLDQIEEASL